MFSTLAIGAIFGAQHVLLGPDHLAAVAPLSARRGAWRIGAAWGLGHGVMSLVLGGIALGLGHVFGAERFESHAELLVGLCMVAMGVWALAGQGRHTHDRPIERSSGERVAFLFGGLHGLGGGLHLAAVLPAAALAGPALFLVAFVLGSTATMCALTGALGTLAIDAERRRMMARVGAVLAIVVGAGWAWFA